MFICKRTWKTRFLLLITLSFFTFNGFGESNITSIITKILPKSKSTSTTKETKKDNLPPRYNTIQQMRALGDLNDVKTFSEEGSDIQFFANVIIKKHQDFDFLVDFLTFCDECTKSIQLMDELAFSDASKEDRLTALYFELCKLTAMLNEQHTFVKAPQAVINNYMVYPINLTTIEKKLIITALGSMYENNVGEEVVEINGYPIGQVHKAMKTIISSSTEVYSIRQADYQLNIQQALEAAGIGSDDGYLIIKLANGHSMRLEPVSYKVFKSLYYNVLRENVPKTIYSGTWYEAWDISQDCLFVKYNVSENDANYKVSQFITDLFYAYDANNFSTMIIDFRSNQGGDAELLEPFIKKLEKYISEEKCSAYVLIGPDTFSYAVSNVLDLKRIGCMIVGTPTGGATNYYGSIKTFELPDSRIVVGCATRYHFKDKSAISKSLSPDVFVDFSIDDYILGNDPQVNWVLTNVSSITR